MEGSPLVLKLELVEVSRLDKPGQRVLLGQLLPSLEWISRTNLWCIKLINCWVVGDLLCVGTNP
jgi:hypothetical protein